MMDLQGVATDLQMVAIEQLGTTRQGTTNLGMAEGLQTAVIQLLETNG
jgi:hypothetical protein